MRYGPIKVFVTIWLGVVISILTIFALCKLGGTWFNLSNPADPPKGAKQQMYESCLEETNGHNTNNCNAILGAKL